MGYRPTPKTLLAGTTTAAADVTMYQAQSSSGAITQNNSATKAMLNKSPKKNSAELSPPSLSASNIRWRSPLASRCGTESYNSKHLQIAYYARSISNNSTRLLRNLRRRASIPLLYRNELVLFAELSNRVSSSYAFLLRENDVDKLRDLGETFSQGADSALVGEVR